MEGKMKILQVTPYFFPSKYGTEHYTIKLIEELDRLGHEVTVFTVNTEKTLEYEVLFNRVHVYRSKELFSYERGLISAEIANKLFHAKNYDVIHVQAPSVYLLPVATFASKINKIPLVATDHGHIAEGVTVLELLNRLSTAFYVNVNSVFIDRIIFFTKSYYESLGLRTAEQRRVRIIPPAIDTIKFHPDIDFLPLKKHLGIRNDSKILLFVGALRASYRQKGVDYLISAMKIVKEKYPEVILIIVGGGELVEEYRQMVSRFGLEENVVFAGHISPDIIPQYYALCDVFVLPSYAEAYGFVLLEAMATGKPVVACEIPGAGEVVNDGITGLKAIPKDPVSLAAKITALLENEELRYKMGENGRQFVEKRTWSDVALETIRVYEEVVSR